MRYLAWAVVFVAAATVTGCAATPAEPDTATPSEAAVEESANLAGCEAFADATSGIADAFSDDTANVNDAWEEVRIAFDEAALQSEGPVQSRLMTLIDEWPNAGDIFVYPEAREEMNATIRDIARACEADGAEVSYSTFVTD